MNISNWKIIIKIIVAIASALLGVLGSRKLTMRTNETLQTVVLILRIVVLATSIICHHQLHHTDVIKIVSG